MVANLAEAASHPVSPETFLEHYRHIRDATRAKDDASMALARTKKAAKTDGMDMFALKLVEQLSKLDNDEAEIRLRNFTHYARFLNKPYGTQLSMFDSDLPEATAKAREEHAIWEAGQAGLRAGQEGHRADFNPHPPGTEKHVTWHRNWKTGYDSFTASQAEIASEMSDNAQDQPKRGRGRPAGSKNKPKDNGGHLQAVA